MWRQRLITAAEEGIIIGVKLACALGLILVTVSYLLNDYSVVRARAANGQQAFEFIQQQLAAQKAAQAPAVKGTP